MSTGGDSTTYWQLQLRQTTAAASKKGAFAELRTTIRFLEYEIVVEVCLFDINLGQEARQSKPPLMHCADWAYNTCGDRIGVPWRE